ncbi:MAG: epoxyqueuosine reductase QueH [Candidatus Omnitrophica bacterium]|nr:epoxyqueuosine reductase QueH [Candidatus Omnitrophota bacterium]
MMRTTSEPLDSVVLLHTCCAPCCGAIIQQCLAEGLRPDIFFYNPNVQPYDEYLQRKASVSAYARKNGLELIDADYDPDVWLAHTKGLEHEPERGKRCIACFAMRLAKTAEYAHAHHYRLFATTNGFSRWKDAEQVNNCGLNAAAPYPGLTFLNRNWRLNNAQSQAAAITKTERFYVQKYCGCLSSVKKHTYLTNRVAIASPPGRH